MVEAVGENVTRFQVGDPVLGIVAEPVLRQGSWAEYVTVPENVFVAPKPPGLGFVEAAALSLAGLTALLAVDAIAPAAGDRVLVVGATGGVGSYAVQLAAQRGATVIATARPDAEEFVRSLGAQETVDYTTQDVAAAIRARYPDGIDGLIDLVNFTPDGFAPMAEVVRPGGRVATPLFVANPEALAARDVTATNVMGLSDPAGLDRLIELAASGALIVEVDRQFKLDDATAALEAFEGGKRGKLAIRVS